MGKLKFKLTDETKINVFGVKLFRIEATASFGNVEKGDKGGWVESETLSNGNARVSGDAWVSGDAQVSGNAQVSGDAWVYGDAQVSGNAQVSGDAWVFGDAQVFGNARVYGDAWVSGDAWVFGDAWVSGDAWVFGDAWVSGNAALSAKKKFSKGWFVAVDDDDTPKKLTVLHGEVDIDGDEDPYWQNTYVLGDYEITDIEEVEKSEDDAPTTDDSTGLVQVTIGDTGFSMPQEAATQLRDAISSVLSED